MTATLLKSRTLTAAVFHRLRADILDGKHRPGTPLRQDLLADTYGVSRIPVREALLQLEAEGLVRIVPHKGAIVTPLTPDEIEDVFDLRLLLEPRLLERSAPLLEAADFDRLDRLLVQFTAAVERGDSGQWGLLNTELHMTLFGRAGRPRSMSVVAGLLQTSERYTRIHLSTGVNWDKARAEHGELVELCRARKTAAACDLLRRHIGEVRDDLELLIA